VSLYGFEQFLAVAQIKQSPTIDQVAWARLLPPHSNPEDPGSGHGQIVGIAIGHFYTDAIQSFLDTHKVAGIQIGNNLLYSAGTGSGPADTFFTVIDSETIAFGAMSGLKRMLSTRTGEEKKPSPKR